MAKSKLGLNGEQMTKETFDLFMAYAKDAGNWSGTPLVGGNVKTTPADLGRISHLKKSGYITTFAGTGSDKNAKYIDFTEKGKKFAATNGIIIVEFNVHRNYDLPDPTVAESVSVPVAEGVQQ